MIPKLCTSCKEPEQNGLVWCVCSWFDANHDRHAYRHRLCLGCTAMKIVPVYIESESPLLSCPACHADTTHDYDAVYGHFVPRGVGEMRFEAPFCPACAAYFRIWFMAGAEELEQQPLESRGQLPAPRYSAAETLAALGIPDRQANA